MIDIILNFISPIAIAVITWFLAKGKYKTEVKTGELDNVEKAISIYKDTIVYLEDRQKKENELYQFQQEKIIQLTKEVILLKKEILDLKKRNE